MDWRMDKLSWFLLVFITATLSYFLLQGAAHKTAWIYTQSILFGLLLTVILVALSCIPVLIICYFIKKIPDIDYSIRFATLFTAIGIISEFIF